MNIFFSLNNSGPNFDGKQLLSDDDDNQDPTINIKSIDYPYSINNNYDKTENVNSADTDENKLTKDIETTSKAKIKNYYSKAFFLIIICFFLISDKIDKNQIDLNNYLDKIYGEGDLLKIIKEKEREMINSSTKKRYKIEKEIENIYNIIEKIKKKKKEILDKNKKIIREDGKLILSCSYSLDNGYIYPTLVAMTSLVINAGNNTFYNIYVLISPDFTEENKNILMSVEKNYTEHCKIFFIDMGNKFEGKDTNFRIPIATYYRLDLHNILPDVDRIIYMDGDTAVFQDLSELIFLDMKGNYILGFLDSNPNALKKYKIKNAIVICAGVILMDLSALRKNNISEKFNKFMEENLGKLEQHDQTTINVVCQGKISTLPPKYGMWNYRTFREFKNFNYEHFSWIRYNKKELSLAHENPAILHYVIGKPFHKFLNKYYYDEWWEYAKKTGYYREIRNYVH